MIHQKMENRPPVQHPAGTKIERKFDKNTGNLVSETEEESYWLEILFVSIGIVVVLVAIFVGIGWLEIGALGGTVGAISSLVGVVIAGKKKSQGLKLRAFDYGLLLVSFLALAGSMFAIYLSVVR